LKKESTSSGKEEEDGYKPKKKGRGRFLVSTS
jgi:hypothetical protein